MENFRPKTSKNIAAGLPKDSPGLQKQGGKGSNETAREGRKIITPRSVTALGGQYRAAVRIKQ
jgi:hypothetical protein